MDYDDMRSRLLRTFSSLNDRFDDDIEKHTKTELWRDNGGITLTFGNSNEAEILNKIMTILHNLSSLKDHLKNCLRKQGLDGQIVEDEINNSPHLQILIDIVNQEKHGTPLKKSRSEKNPVIRYPAIGYYPFRQSSRTNSSKDNIGTMAIHALIKDDKENLLFSLDELVETCYKRWESIAKQYNCT